MADRITRPMIERKFEQYKKTLNLPDNVTIEYYNGWRILRDPGNPITRGPRMTNREFYFFMDGAIDVAIYMERFNPAQDKALQRALA